MYISTHKTHTGDSGKSYFTHRLVRSERNANKVKTVILLNLGSRFSVPKKLWKSLCARVQEILSPMDTLFATRLDDGLENEAQRIAAQLLASGATISKHSESDCGGQPGTALQQVDIESFDSFRPRTVGVENIGLWACQTLGVPQLFESLGFNGRERATALRGARCDYDLMVYADREIHRLQYPEHIKRYASANLTRSFNPWHKSTLKLLLDLYILECCC